MNISSRDGNSRDPETRIGPGNVGEWNSSDPKEIKKRAESGDLYARAVMDVRKEIDDDRKRLKLESDKFIFQFREHGRNLKRTDALIIGVLIFVATTFVTTMSLVFFDLIKEKELYLKYNDIYKNYSDDSSEYGIEMNNLRWEIKALEDRIDRQ